MKFETSFNIWLMTPQSMKNIEESFSCPIPTSCGPLSCDYYEYSNYATDAYSSLAMLSKFESQLKENLENMTRIVMDKLAPLVNHNRENPNIH